MVNTLDSKLSALMLAGSIPVEGILKLTRGLVIFYSYHLIILIRASNSLPMAFKQWNELKLSNSYGKIRKERKSRTRGISFYFYCRARRNVWIVNEFQFLLRFPALYLILYLSCK